MPACSTPNFVIVTPAYNEAAYIDETIESVAKQTVRPICWLIVDDGSTDETPEKIRRAEERYPWVRGHRRTKDPAQSYFASNVYALADGIALLADMEYNFLAILDADMVLPEDYYEQIFARFEREPALGAASGVYLNRVGGQLQKVINDRRSTPKAIQVFRRECFEQIGGYVPLKYGGEDTCSCIMARQRGWKSWSFPELQAIHCRPTGMGGARGVIRARFRQGLCDYGVGSHPLFMLVKALRRCLFEPPFLVGGTLRLAGYLWGCVRREPYQIPEEVVRFVRRDQLRRVFGLNRVPEENRVNWETA